MTEDIEMDDFIENCIRKYNIDKTSKTDIKEIIITSIVINYYSDIQFTIFKRYLENKTKKHISDDDMYELVKLVKPKRKDSYSFFDTEILTTEDRKRIYNDIHILIKIFDKNLVNDYMIPGISFAIDKLKEYDYSILANRRDCIENIKTKIDLIDMGIENYIDKNLKKIIKV